ncbi:MAG: helix-turn-helix domain-containing protein [Clostridia bacterium]
MENIKLNEQIAFLRRQKGLTQEELARTLGVTNQAVSKWESSLCCPDITLLPDIAKLFDVSIDELMGYKSADTFENVYLKIKSLFAETPAESVFENAFRLSVLLHEAACTQGYKGYTPWDTNKNYGMEKCPHKWGFSACSEPQGNTVYSGNGIFIANGKSYQTPSISQIHDLYFSLKRLAEKNVLKVLYAIYEMTANDFDMYVSLTDITSKCSLSEADVTAALENIPVTIKDDENGEPFYRIEGSYMHVPSLLLLLRNK